MSTVSNKAILLRTHKVGRYLNWVAFWSLHSLWRSFQPLDPEKFLYFVESDKGTMC